MTVISIISGGILVHRREGLVLPIQCQAMRFLIEKQNLHASPPRLFIAAAASAHTLDRTPLRYQPEVTFRSTGVCVRTDPCQCSCWYRFSSSAGVFLFRIGTEPFPRLPTSHTKNISIMNSIWIQYAGGAANFICLPSLRWEPLGNDAKIRTGTKRCSEYHGLWHGGSSRVLISIHRNDDDDLWGTQLTSRGASDKESRLWTATNSILL